MQLTAQTYFRKGSVRTVLQMCITAV
uniref:Uncharacterized protein n=1 Tax=Anguilla anguilla TaxID=7936 RepID=A0A0E9T1X3_ANGAN